ncbi:hypothetical protein FQN53_005378 [Emmonsiellopsis sp. PD_33]|nr:hypothetical protein FQN53_005378 [Emmonsiellopsis sp. PD_33]
MLRLRRYRVFVVFAIISVLAFVHFARVHDWRTSPSSTTVPNNDGSALKQNPAAPPPEYPPNNNNNNNGDGKPAHGFAPELTTPLPKPAPKPEVTIPVVNQPAGEKTEKPASDPNAPQLEPGKSIPQGKPRLQDWEIEFGAQGQGRVEVDNLDRSGVRWEKQPEHFPVAPEEVISLPAGTPKKLPKVQFEFPEESASVKAEREKKLATIKESFSHSWAGYKEHAWGHDELRPVLGGSRDPFGGWGATLVDALDTLWMMDMKEEFEEAVEAVKNIDFQTSPRKDIPLFETTIRYLGGLIGAYDVSGGKYESLLDKAKELAEILIGAFDTPNRMPLTYYYWAPAYASQPHRAPARVVMAELGSLSVEFTRLAQITGEARFYDAIARITNELEKFQDKTRLPGLWPAHIDASGCKKTPRLSKQDPDDKIPVVPGPALPERQNVKREEDPLLVDAQPADYNVKPGSQSQAAPAPANKLSTSDLFLEQSKPRKPSEYDCEDQDLASPPSTVVDRFTMGGLADSTYEYLPKEYALLGGLNEQYRTMYEKAMDTVKKYLLFRPMLPDQRDILFLASGSAKQAITEKSQFNYKYDGSHLVCFAGGMFALGAKVFGIEDHLDIAKKLTDGCVWAYESTATGIMPEAFEVLPCPSLEACEWNKTAYYDALDPYQADRKARHELARSQYEKLNIGAKAGGNEPEAPKPQSIPQLPDGPSQDDGTKVVKRQEDPAPAQVADPVSQPERTPTPWDPTEPPMLLSHEEFAEEVIKEERLPPGMISITGRKYILRPEAIESVFIMYRVTGDEYWREKGWKMFQAIEAATRTDIANSAIKDVTSRVPFFTGEMESFWLAETLKYFYLLFSDPSVVSLDDYVL